MQKARGEAHGGIQTVEKVKNLSISGYLPLIKSVNEEQNASKQVQFHRPF
uniref:Uncharacterized protein n=1 Tax=Rhizophora mucronata TaxID=61149 RepID=A0A2P2MXM5_RHIMU